MPQPPQNVLLYAESGGFLHCEEQLVVQHFRGPVGGQVEPVEAGVGPGETGGPAPLLDAELPGPVAAPESSEPLVGDGGGAGHELQEPKPLFIAEPLDGHPKPLHHGVAVVVPRPAEGQTKGL